MACLAILRRALFFARELGVADAFETISLHEARLQLQPQFPCAPRGVPTSPIDTTFDLP